MNTNKSHEEIIHHILIIGRLGSGKSNLLRVLDREL